MIVAAGKSGLAGAVAVITGTAFRKVTGNVAVGVMLYVSIAAPLFLEIRGRAPSLIPNDTLPLPGAVVAQTSSTSAARCGNHRKRNITAAGHRTVRYRCLTEVHDLAYRANGNDARKMFGAPMITVCSQPSIFG